MKTNAGAEKVHTISEPRHEISSNQQSLRSTCAYAQSDQSLCKSLGHSLSVNLLTEHYLEFLRFKGGYTSESTLVKMAHCWKSHVTANVCHHMRKPTIWLYVTRRLRSARYQLNLTRLCCLRE